MSWQRPFTYWKTRYRSIISPNVLSYGEKIVKIGGVYPETKYAIFCHVAKKFPSEPREVTGPKFTKFYTI